MFGFFKSNRAVKDTEDVLMQVMAPMEKYLSGVVFRDAYCIGFLQMVAMHTATESLKITLFPSPCII